MKYKFSTATNDTAKDEIAVLKKRIEQDKNTLSVAMDMAQLADIYVSQAKKTGSNDFYREAELLADRSLVLVPKNADAVLVKVKILISRHDFKQAFEMLNQISQPGKNVPEVAYLRAIIHLALSEFPEALAQINYLIKAKPDSGSATLKALVLGHMGQDDLAFHYFRRALQLEDIGEEAQSVLTRAQLAQFFIKKGEYQMANRVCDAGLSIMPGNPFLNLVKAQVLNSQKKYKEAYELLSKAFAASREPTYLLNMLFSLKVLKREADFKILADEALKIYQSEAKETYGHLLDLASVYYVLNDFEQAEKTILLDQQNRKNLRGDLILAKIYIHQKKYEKARDILELQIAKGATDVSLFYLMMIVLKESKNQVLYDLFSERVLKNNTDYNDEFLMTIP